ncbi:hypothetical protein RBB78_19350 [Tunturiibacter empetritectus]|uniref:hypothetical protein n=1 Tax=Tunturiibacter empetritectus TaxID=3069691 RepID=UPI003D9BE208
MAKQSIAAHKSWLPDANHATTDFPLTHLPYAAFTREGQQHLCVAIGSHLLDLHACASSGLLPHPHRGLPVPNPQPAHVPGPSILGSPPQNPHHPPPRRRKA